MNPRHAKFASQMARSTYQVFDENLIQISQDAGNHYAAYLLPCTLRILLGEGHRSTSVRAPKTPDICIGTSLLTHLMNYRKYATKLEIEICLI